MWLTRYLVIQNGADKRIEGMLRATLSDVDQRLIALRGRENISSKVARTRLISVKAEIHRALSLLWLGMRTETQSNQARAMAAALQASFDWDETILKAAFPRSDDREDMRNYLEFSVSRNVELAVRRISGEVRPLSARVYGAQKLSTGWVDRTVNNALARGASWKDLADDVRSSIKPNVPGGVAYAAKRLGRTELNNAYHAMSAELTRDKPWVTGVDWNLSKSHPKIDICNFLADGGPYPTDSVPAKGHPQCLCYISPALPSVEDFVAGYRAGLYDDYLTVKYGRAS